MLADESWLDSRAMLVMFIQPFGLNNQHDYPPGAFGCRFVIHCRAR
jgi:hypothetical protein